MSADEPLNLNRTTHRGFRPSSRGTGGKNHPGWGEEKGPRGTENEHCPAYEAWSGDDYIDSDDSLGLLVSRLMKLACPGEEEDVAVWHDSPEGRRMLAACVIADYRGSGKPRAFYFVD